MGPSGVATKSMCFDEIQEKYTRALSTSTTSTAVETAEELAEKVGLKFSARIAQAEKLRDAAVDFYNEETIGPVSAPDLFCMDTCSSCTYDSAFFSQVDRTKYGVRYGARADEAGTAGRLQSEDVAQRLGNKMVHPTTGIYEVDPTTKWTFLGTEEGIMTMAPHGVGSEAKCRSYDPRTRPWYSEGYMRAKNLVVVIDGSNGNSAAEFLTLKQGAQAVIGTLAAGDTANVVFARSSSSSPSVPGGDSSDLTYDSCHSGQMLRTGVVNKALLSRFVDEAVVDTSDGAADLAAAITVAQNLISAQRDVSSAYPTIESSDVIIVLAASDSDPSTGFVALKEELKPPVTWFLHTLASGQVATESFDRFEVMAQQDAGFSPARYYTLPALATNRETFASAFYLDSSLGMVTSVVSPVVVDGAIRAMVGTDVMVQELVADLVFERDFSSSYPFIVDSAGQTVWHPALPAPADGAVEPVNILDLEISSGFKNNVVAGLIAGESGSWSGTVSVPVPRGDATYSGFAQVSREVTFAWKPIAGTPFRIGVVVTAEDEEGVALSSPPITTSDCSTFDPIDCDVYHMLDWDLARCGNIVSNGMIKYVSSAFYAASAFGGPSEWLQKEERERDVRQLIKASTCGKPSIPSFDYGVGSLKEAAINDNMLLRGDVDTCWKTNDNDKVIWTYFGSSNGLMRMMPATQQRKKYDPTKRSWYVGAVANTMSSGGWGVTISTPYLDSSGAGEVVTVSKVVEGSGGDVAGVSGADLTLGAIKGMLGGVCAEENVVCMLMDETGHLVYHPDFAGTSHADENVFLSVKARELAGELVQAGMFEQNTCMDYSTGRRKTSYQLSADIGASQGELGCGGYAISRVGDSNVYLVGVSSNGCEDGQPGESVDCKVCSSENCANWDANGMDDSLLCQPCQCNMDYDSCGLRYGEDNGAVVACPAAPPPLFDDLCGVDAGAGGAGSAAHLGAMTVAVAMLGVGLVW